jgi:hypothetical protein
MTAKQKFDLETLKKHHFWIVVSAAALFGVVGAVWAIIAVANETETQRKKREDVVRETSTYPEGPSQPNEKFPPFAEQKHKELAQVVLEAWRRRYEQQYEFVDGRWPFWLRNYQADIERAIREGKEIDRDARQLYYDRKLSTVEFESLFLDEKGNRWLREQEEVAVSPSAGKSAGGSTGAGRPISGSQEDPMAGTAAGSAGAGGRVPPGEGPERGAGAGAFGSAQDNAGTATEWRGLIHWDPAEIERLRTRLALTNYTTRPTSEEMRYCQESINVYRVLLRRVIHETNNSITEHRHLAIKRIIKFLIGEEVTIAGTAAADSNIPGESRPPPGSGPVGAGTGSGAPPPMGAGTGGGASAAVGGGGDEEFAGGQVGDTNFGSGGSGYAGGYGGVQTLPAPDGKNRYVHDKGQRVADPTKQPFTEFRLLPVEFRLIIDQRRINDFLVNCANCPLPIEVQQVNIRSLDSASASGQSGSSIPGGGPMGGGPLGGSSLGGGPAPMGSGTGGAGGATAPAVGGGAGAGLGRRPPGEGDDGGNPGFGGNASGGSDQSPAVEVGPHDVELHVRGIIYLFNPPNPSAVGISPTESAPTATPAVPAPPPAAPPAAGAPAATTPAAGTPAPGAATPAATQPAGAGGATAPAASGSNNTPSGGGAPPAGTPPAGAGGPAPPARG